MEFTPEFKLKVYECLKNHPNIKDLMTSLEEGDDLSFRFQLDVVMDSIEVGLKPRILVDVGDMELWNGQVRYYFEVNSIYADLMEMITDELDESLTSVITKKNDEDSPY